MTDKQIENLIKATNNVTETVKQIQEALSELESSCSTINHLLPDAGKEVSKISDKRAISIAEKLLKKPTETILELAQVLKKETEASKSSFIRLYNKDLIKREETCANRENCIRQLQGCGSQQCPEYDEIDDCCRGCFD